MQESFVLSALLFYVLLLLNICINVLSYVFLEHMSMCCYLVCNLNHVCYLTGYIITYVFFPVTSHFVCELACINIF